MPARFDSLFVALTLLAGLLVGFAGSTLAYRSGLLRVPHEGMVQRMDRMLKLTTAQHEQVLEVLQDSRFKVDQMRREFQHQRTQLLTQAFAQIRGILTPEQQKEFDRSFAAPRNYAGPHENKP